ncbi:MAG: hypothetical protein GKC10_06175 [Methanosarcinales archaeon]|nr:hypothetical protein [Methanosarcinales archaeon]
MDYVEFKILKAIADLQVPYPQADRIRERSGIDAEDLGVRLELLEMQGYVRTRRESTISDRSLPGGIYAAGLTTAGKRAMAGERW